MANMKDNEWLKHAYELTSAADMVNEWSRSAKKDDDSAKASR